MADGAASSQSVRHTLQSHEAQLPDGRTLGYCVLENPDAPAPEEALVFLHGFPGSRLELGMLDPTALMSTLTETLETLNKETARRTGAAGSSSDRSTEPMSTPDLLARDVIPDPSRLLVVSVDRPGFGASTFYGLRFSPKCNIPTQIFRKRWGCGDKWHTARTFRERNTHTDLAHDIKYLITEHLHIPKFSLLAVSGGGIFAAAAAATLGLSEDPARTGAPAEENPQSPLRGVVISGGQWAGPETRQLPIPDHFHVQQRWLPFVLDWLPGWVIAKPMQFGLLRLVRGALDRLRQAKGEAGAGTRPQESQEVARGAISRSGGNAAEARGGGGGGLAHQPDTDKSTTTRVIRDIVFDLMSHMAPVDRDWLAMGGSGEPPKDRVYEAAEHRLEIMLESLLESFKHGDRGVAQELELLSAKADVAAWVGQLSCSPVADDGDHLVPPRRRFGIFHGALDTQVARSHCECLAAKVPGCQTWFSESHGHLNHLDSPEFIQWVARVLYGSNDRTRI